MAADIEPSQYMKLKTQKSYLQISLRFLKRVQEFDVQISRLSKGDVFFRVIGCRKRRPDRRERGPTSSSSSAADVSRVSSIRAKRVATSLSIHHHKRPAAKNAPPCPHSAALQSQLSGPTRSIMSPPQLSHASLLLFLLYDWWDNSLL